MEYRKDPHRVYSLTYHLIFVVKYRQPVFIEEIGIIEALKTKIIELSENFEVKVVEIECGIDHVHLLISAKPMLDIPKYINTIKGHSSRFLRKAYKSFLQDKLWGAHFWSPRYFISSTGNVSIDVLKQYGENEQRKIALEH
ncbi:MAG: IS200/IS605 family transposase [Candidatus Lokiarchaeota archaeon]|nr:IS200/IS605 family transposase [Candidatus Lokiarchaeota archaeon]